MTVKRQYTLPFCNLVVEGLSANANDPLSPLTVLMNAECQLPAATDVPLAGGREFLDSLVMAVSRYGQQLLSGIPQPTPAPGSPPSLVDVKPGDDGAYHHLIVRQQPLGEPVTDANALAPLDVKLNTVQFYDLMEAVDQLLADPQTLPDLTAQFQAVSRKFVKPAEPVAKRAAPAALGAAALAAAGIALFFVPPPEFKPSRPDREADTPADTSTAAPTTTTPPVASSGPTATAELGDLESLTNAPAMTDTAAIAELQAGLSRRLQEAWGDAPKPTENLVYRVVVDETGEVVGYKYDNDAALAEVDRTPLPALAFKGEPASPPAETAVTQFLTTFTPSGEVRVEPWAGSETTTAANTPVELPTLDSKITDGETIRRLNSTLYDSLLAKLEPLSAEEPLSYRVRLTTDGAVVGYEAINEAANRWVAETPLPQLQSANPGTGEQADFKVVFTETGVLEVSPWDGWPQ